MRDWHPLSCGKGVTLKSGRVPPLPTAFTLDIVDMMKTARVGLLQPRLGSRFNKKIHWDESSEVPPYWRASHAGSAVGGTGEWDVFHHFPWHSHTHTHIAPASTDWANLTLFSEI